MRRRSNREVPGYSGRESGRPLLVNGRVNEPAFAALVGEPIERATSDFVRETTGYAIGGIPPVGLVRPMSVWMDRDLLGYEQSKSGLRQERRLQYVLGRRRPDLEW